MRMYEITIRLIELIAAFAMMSGLGVLFYRVKKLPAETKEPVPLGSGTVQLIAVTMAIPLVLILGLEGRLDSSAIGTLLGVFFGYVFSHLGRCEAKSNPP